jgi:hypothetical protein
LSSSLNVCIACNIVEGIQGFENHVKAVAKI